MKYLFTILMMVFVFASMAQTQDEAIAWNDKLVDSQKKMLALEDEMIVAITEDGDIETIAVAYINYLTYINETIAYYESVDPFDRKDIFRKELLKLFGVFRDVAVNEYAEILKLWFTPADDLSEEDFNRWDELINIVDEKEIASNDKFLEVQIEFAKKYKFVLE